MDKQQLKKMIKLILYILVISYVIDKIVFLSISKISDHVYSGQAIGKLNQYLELKDSVDLMVFGSSRANHHINVSMLSSSSFNMGMDGMFIAHNAALIKLLPQEKKQTIILHFDPNDAYNKAYTGDEIKSLMVKYHRNDIIKSEIDNADKSHFLQAFFWCLDYNGMFLGILKNAIAPNYDYKSYTGYDPLDVSEAQQDMFKISLANSEKEVCDLDLKINPIFKTNLNSIKLYCEKNNKKLIVITTPFYDDTCKNDNLKLKTLLEDLNIIYYDYSDFFKDNNRLEFWKDETHMSKTAAELFSKQLRIQLLNHDLIN